MNLMMLDYVLLGVIVVSALIGVLRGFVRESLSLLTWILAIWAAARFGAEAGGLLGDWIADPLILLWAGRLMVLVGVLVVGSVIGAIIGHLVSHSLLTGTDRLLGMLFGLGRGVLLAALGVLVLEMAGFEQEEWWRESRLVPQFAPLGGWLRELAGQGLDYLDGAVWLPARSDAA
ncbi:MAG: CvpA family protein [Chromatiales bacterium]|nr:CvpA family protein [Chromatiales bacterium]